MVDDPLEPQLAIVRLDYERTLGVIDGVVRVSTALRQTAVAAGVALSGVAAQLAAPELALAAAILAVLLGVLDAYHGALYAAVLARAAAMEDLFGLRMRALAQPGDAPVRERLALRLAAHRLGPASTLPRIGWRDLATARPRGVYAIYPVLVAGALLAAGVTG